MNDGGPAFPTESGQRYEDGSFEMEGVDGGMTMRQYYKAAALKGMLSSDIEAGMSVVDVIQCSARLADAMIAEDEAFAAKEREAKE